MPTTDRDALTRLLAARHGAVSIVTFEEEHALAVCREAAVATGRELWLWTIIDGLRDGLISGTRGLADSEHPAGALALIHQGPAVGRIYVFCELACHIEKDERIRRLYRECVDKCEERGSTIVLIDHTDPPPVVKATASMLELSYPSEAELEAILRSTLREIHRDKRIDVQAGREDLKAILHNLRGLTRRQARQAIIETVAHDGRFNAEDVVVVQQHKRKALAGIGLLEHVDAPTDVSQIGGLDRLKTWLGRRQEALSDRAREFGISPPRGLLLLGVQGAGKSLASKAVATAWRRPLLKMDVGALYDRYIGESERRLRDALRQAEMMSPVILWIDEIEKAFAGAASQSNDGGLSRRMFGTLLTWMQEHRAPVFMIATANDIAALPPELLRKGRFDEIFFVDLPGEPARRAIFEIHLKKRKRNPNQFDLLQLVAESEGYSGAEIEQAIEAGLHTAFAAGRELEQSDIVSALQESPPLSVTRAEQIAELRAWARDRCVPAD